MELPLVDGNYVSYAEIEIRLAIPFGQPFETRDVTAIDWEDSFDPGEVRGAGPKKLGDTKGQYSCSATMTMLKDKCIAFQQALMQSNPLATGVSDIPFDIIVNWVPLSVEGQIHTVEIIGCTIKARKTSNASGNEATATVIDLNPKEIIEDGIRL